MNRKEEFYWNRLDNTAKVYPAISSSRSSNVYRICVKLKEPVKPEVLEQALQETLQQLPIYNVKLRKGLFWYYFETNFSKPVVREDHLFPCTPIDKWPNNGFLFRLTYFDKKINWEVFHALSDGNGAIFFLNCLILNYLQLAHPQDAALNGISLIDSTLPQSAFEENSFLSAAREIGADVKAGTAIPALPRAYQVSGVPAPLREVRVIQLFLESRSLIALAKASGVTVTAYLAAVLFLSIYEESWRYSRRRHPISICVPVDLRSFFPSHTLRNFFSTINMTLDFSKKDYTFQELLEFCSNELQRQITHEGVLQKVRSNVHAEESMALRLVPLFLKNLVLKGIGQKTENGNTTTLSNLGRIKLPEAMAPYLQRYEVMVSPSKHQTVKLGVISYDQTMCLSFVSGIEETDVPRYFCRFLTQQGIDIRVSSNMEVSPDEAMS